MKQSKLYLKAFSNTPVACVLADYGAFLEESSLSALLTPPSMKDSPSDDSPLFHGKRYDTSTPKKKERQLSLTLGFKASTFREFMTNYYKFCRDVLDNKRFKLIVPDFATFTFIYASCGQVEEWGKSGVAKFVLKVIEPNPEDRTYDIDDI